MLFSRLNFNKQIVEKAQRIKISKIVFIGLISISSSATELQDLSALRTSSHQPMVASEISSKVNSLKDEELSQTNTRTYIVKLFDKPLATYGGGIDGLEATSNRVTGAKKLNVHSKKSKAYKNYLEKKQHKILHDSGLENKVKFDYQLVFNGMAIEMTSAEAKALAQKQEIAEVTLDKMETLLTDNGPTLINADTIWYGFPNNVPHSQGEGLVIAVLDTGINHTHPSFADIGGDGYDHTNPLGEGNYIPGSYCDNNPNFCNDKLIGAWDFVNDPDDNHSPGDSSKHGSHVSSIVAGNVIKSATVQAPTISITREISGVAPHANIIVYDVCVKGCSGSALLAALNQVVVDSAELPNGIHSLNYSISGSGNPYKSPVELGFLNATAAGIYVAAAAGNSGPGVSTVNHSSPWVSTTANMTHDRKIVNRVVEMTSDSNSLPDMEGLGFTGSFGPAKIINSADLEDQFPGSTLCGSGSLGDFKPPWPAGTFNGEIVACQRGTYGRVEKGANLLTAGAGGYILMDNGSGLHHDKHHLPAVHISKENANELVQWLANNTNPIGMVQGTTVEADIANADIMATSSSRGPSLSLDVMKPDIGAPGVKILGAINEGDNYEFLTGTSMASPFNAGAGAIVSAARPTWTPYAVKSAIMMTSKNDNLYKQDGITTADSFDRGAGRIDLARATEVGLVLNETPENFLLSNPELDGDPKTLNLASMMNSSCLETCSWTRTFTNVTQHTIHVDLSINTIGNADFTVQPSSLKIKQSEQASFTVTANTALATDWNFADLNILRRGDGPDLHMPIAVKAAISTNPTVFNKTVDKSEATNGEILTYTLSIAKGELDGEISLNDKLPAGVNYVAGSAKLTINNGITTLPFAEHNNELSWSGSLNKGGVSLQDASLYGYIPLSNYFSPSSLPSNCDDGALLLDVEPFNYNGESHNQVIWSVNGALEAGSSSNKPVNATNRLLPSKEVQGNLMAPWWTDLNLCAGGNWYTGSLTDGTNTFTIFEWQNAPLYSDNSKTATFQIWLTQGADDIYFIYKNVPGGKATIGAQNTTGTLGETRYFNGNSPVPSPNEQLLISPTPSGSATFSFEATASCLDKVVINRANLSNNGSTDRAIAVTKINGC